LGTTQFILKPFAQNEITKNFSVNCTAQLDETQLHLTWTVQGPLNEILIPVRDSNTDTLWEHTCFEFFLKLKGEGYLEWNFSPSGAYQCYEFARYRIPVESTRHDLPSTVVRSISAVSKPLVQNVEIDLSQLALPSIIGGPAVVLEKSDHQLSYWAVTHPNDEPDFHRLEITARRLS
jgi:hypothetical protein